MKRLILPYKILTLGNLTGEKWKWVGGFKGQYMVSNKGRIKSFMRQYSGGIIIMKQQFDSHGYLKIGLKKKSVSCLFCVHQLVGKAFISNPKNRPFINHKRGKKLDNRASQLEWCFQSENIEHAIATGLTKQKGGDSANAFFTNKQALAIFNSTDSRFNLAKKYKVAVTIIHNIKNGRTYSCVTKKVHSKKYDRLSHDTIIEISKSLGTECAIAKEYGVSAASVKCILKGQRHSKLTGISHSTVRLPRSKIMRVYRSKKTYQKITEQFGVCMRTVCLIKTGKRHNNITGHSK